MTMSRPSRVAEHGHGAREVGIIVVKREEGTDAFNDINLNLLAKTIANVKVDDGETTASPGNLTPTSTINAFDAINTPNPPIPDQQSTSSFPLVNPRCPRCRQSADRFIVELHNETNAGRRYYKCLNEYCDKVWVTWDDAIGIDPKNAPCECGVASRQDVVCKGLGG